jgi:hypothetical protein
MMDIKACIEELAEAAEELTCEEEWDLSDVRGLIEKERVARRAAELVGHLAAWSRSNLT